MIKRKKRPDITELLPGVKKNILLKNYTTFKIGGRAKYFYVARTEKDLILAVNSAKKINLPFFILGAGSNVLVKDREFKGLVIKIKNTRYKIQNTKIIADAGTLLGVLVSLLANKRLTGLEWAVSVPGTAGGATRGNAGAFGRSMADNVETVKVYDVKNKKIRIFKNKDCRFSYRNSVFKKKKDLIIISAILKLKKGNRKDIKNRIKEYLNYRIKHQPLKFPSAGSIFINPKNYSAGELIEKCGLKGKRAGHAQISKIHANFIINLGEAEAKDVKKLIDLTKKKVKQKFGIALKEEIECLG